MKRWVIAGAGALVWMAAASPSGAADIPAAPVAKAPVMVPAAKQSWYGFYIGLHGGYGWGRNAITATPDAFYAPLFLAAGFPNTAAGNPKGFIGGITYGSNYQFDRIVVGFDSDFSYTDIKASQTINATVLGVPITTNASQKLSWFGTTRVRGGFLLTDNILLYGTGGLASGRIEANANNVVNIAGGCLLAGGCPAGGISQNRWGWAAGGGIEFAEGPWQFRAEYLHYDLGTVNFLMRDAIVPLNTIGNSLKVSGDMVRGAISYRFNWTPFGLIFGTDRI
ncbi:MAG: outer rane immunogenic protein [Hyphomicrobiales bacterium]|jgi:outer membrane immunogenic protein|nr:outer rane immunogenic protein [Hyphomicrobiales bacterium]